MKTFIIDYRCNGRKDWRTIQAESKDEALRIFRSAGVDGWTGVPFDVYEAILVSERS